MTAPRGRFITLEGGEGAGKSTLAAGLKGALQAAGHRAVCTREPGGSVGADAIRALLVRGDAERWSTLSETLLLSAARCDHLERTIRPALASGAWVVCDRFIDSTRAYQVAARGLPTTTLQTLNDLIDAPIPDLTLVLDVDPTLGLHRSGGVMKGEDRFERLSEAFHSTVRRAFLDIAAAEPHRCVVLDASRSAEAVLEAALDALHARAGLP